MAGCWPRATRLIASSHALMLCWGLVSFEEFRKKVL